MKRKITLLVCIIVTAALIFGACNQTPGPSASPTPGGSAAGSDTVIIGEIDGQPVYKSELESWLAMIGGSDVLIDPYYADSLQDVLDDFILDKIRELEITKRGYLGSLTSDQITEAEQSAQDAIDSIVLSSGTTEEELLASVGITKDQLIQQYKLSYAEEAAFNDLVGGIEPTEDQIKNEYDSEVASQKAAIDADPTQYVSYVNSGRDVYYVPPGARMVRMLLIPIDASWADSIAVLRGSGYDEQADLLLERALSDIKTKADEAADKISKGLSFSDAMQQYNQDTEAPDGGYPVMAGTTDYPDAFTETAMALTTSGQISDLFATDEGYMIIEYTSDVTPGTADYESVKDKISESLLAQVQGEAWTAMKDGWKNDHSVKTFIENL